MKKCVLSATVGALAMLIALTVIANIGYFRMQQPKEYRHIDYKSNITPADCFVCGDSHDFTYWGQNNVGIVNLNTFDLLNIEIKRYDDFGNLIKRRAGYMTSSGISDNRTKSSAHAYIFPDDNFANVQISGVQYDINRKSLEKHLCQFCLDSINDLCIDDLPPAEYAIISFENLTIQPLFNNRPWFSSGNYGIDCEFQDDGQIKLLIHYLESTI